MPTSKSVLRVRTLRGSLLMVGLATLGGCLVSMDVAVADEPASDLTLRQLFQAETSKESDANDSPLFGDEGASGTSMPLLVTYFADDEKPEGDEEKDDQATEETEGEDENKGSEADKEANEASKSELNLKPKGDRLGGASIFGGDAERSPTIRSGRFSLPPLMVATTQTSEIGNGRLPDGFRGDENQLLASLPESGLQRGVDWDWTVRTWTAPNTFSHPRYFEDRMLERHGHERFPHLQPIASGARFFATIPMLPYLATVRPPCDCEYTLGYYRTGSCAPALKQRPPYERKAVVAEAAAIAGHALIVP